MPWVSDKVDYILYFEKQETIDISVSWDETEIHHIEKKPEIVIPNVYTYTSITIIIIFVIMTCYHFISMAFQS